MFIKQIISNKLTSQQNGTSNGTHTKNGRDPFIVLRNALNTIEGVVREANKSEFDCGENGVIDSREHPSISALAEVNRHVNAAKKELVNAAKTGDKDKREDYLREMFSRIRDFHTCLGQIDVSSRLLKNDLDGLNVTRALRNISLTLEDNFDIVNGLAIELHRDPVLERYMREILNERMKEYEQDQNERPRR